MKSLSKSRRASRLPHLFVLLLGFAVLFWGAEYKYSLYLSPSQGQALLPPAKLLSQRERPPESKSDGIEAAASKAPIALTLLAFTFAASASRLSFKLREAGLAERPSRPCASLTTACFIHFAFRPPPAYSQLTST